MNMFQGLRTIIYSVKNLPTATAWYTQLVGKEPYFNEPFYVGFNIGGYELGLIPGGADGEGSTTYWGTANIETEYARMLSIGAKPHSPINDVGNGIRVATLLDPDGNTVGLIENPHFKIVHAN